jgi:predicted DNA-binding transcriptional regulator AlpA
MAQKNSAESHTSSTTRGCGLETNLTENARLLTEKQVSSYISMSLSWLRQARHRCTGIPYSKIGRSVRYRHEDVLNYCREHRITPLFDA